MNNLHSYKHTTRQEITPRNRMSVLVRDTNISAPTLASHGVSSSSEAKSGLVKRQLSFRPRRGSTALGLLNRGLSNWYPGNSENDASPVDWRDDETQSDFERKMDILLKNTHLFEKFKERVAQSETVANPIVTRTILEDFLQHDLLFVGKQGMIQRHSELIRHLGLTQRLASSCKISTEEAESSGIENQELSQQQPTKELYHYSLSKSDNGLSETESSDSSCTEDSSRVGSPTWSPETADEHSSAFANKEVQSSLQIPNLA